MASNKADEAAEATEGRGLAKGNPRQQNTLRAQDREGAPSALSRVRQAAQRNRNERFTSLYHLICDVEGLRSAFYQLKRSSAPGVDGETWHHYEGALDANLCDLSARLRRGAYRPKPVRRVYIPKSDGKQRPLGIPALEDKLVQRRAVEVLNAIYEVDFVGFSYGFRPGRDPHQALNALHAGLHTEVNWVLDADIRGFFDAIDHGWLVKFVEHRIADRRVVRLIQKWLKAGVLEDGEWRSSEEGAPQGGSISPLLANLYLHYAFDQWVQQWRTRTGWGRVIVVRYADDFVLGFQHEGTAKMFLAALKERLQKFNLELHPEKTRLLPFGRYTAGRREERGERGKRASFNFLGFTHLCARSRDGKFQLLRVTERKRMRIKLRGIKDELRRRMHRSVPSVGRWLRSVLQGHFNYYGVPLNGRALSAFRFHVVGLWYRTLRRRSQRTCVTWERMTRLSKRWIPPARITRSYPPNLPAVSTQGRSRMR